MKTFLLLLGVTLLSGCNTHSDLNTNFCTQDKLLALQIEANMILDNDFKNDPQAFRFNEIAFMYRHCTNGKLPIYGIKLN